MTMCIYIYIYIYIYLCTIDSPIENGEVSIAMLNCQRVLSPTPNVTGLVGNLIVIIRSRIVLEIPN